VLDRSNTHIVPILESVELHYIPTARLYGVVLNQALEKSYLFPLPVEIRKAGNPYKRGS
jgi:hypothetical protein